MDTEWERFIGDEYLDQRIDERFEVVDVYYDTIKNKWIASVTFEEGYEKKYPIEELEDNEKVVHLPN